MAISPELHPVVEAPWSEEGTSWPWPVADRPAFSHIRLSGTMSLEDVGSVIANLVSYNQVECGPTVTATLDAIISTSNEPDHRFLLSGGIETTGELGTISPRCCCGLEAWREWWAFLETGHSPWLGHDPIAWVQRDGDIIRVWSEGGFTNVPSGFAIEFDLARFYSELDRVQTMLIGFLNRVGEWATSLGYAHPQALADVMDRSFHITQSYEHEEHDEPFAP